MSIVLLPCGGLCGGSLTVTCQTKSASLTKCGFNEFGTPSSPPKVYRTATQSGTTTNTNLDGSCLVVPGSFSTAWGGNATYARGTCALTEARTVTIASSVTSCSSTLNLSGGEFCADALYGGFGGYAFENVLEGVGGTCPANCAAVHCLQGVGTAAIGGTTSISVTASVGGTSGSATVTLSNEYLTSDLYSDCLAALNSASWGSSGSCAGVTADYIMASDEKSLSMSAVRYSLAFPAALPGTSYFYDRYDNGSYLLTGSVTLSAGQTSDILDYFYNNFGFFGSFSSYLTNFRIACSA